MVLVGEGERRFHSSERERSIGVSEGELDVSTDGGGSPSEDGISKSEVAGVREDSGEVHSMGSGFRVQGSGFRVQGSLSPLGMSRDNESLSFNDPAVFLGTMANVAIAADWSAIRSAIENGSSMEKVASRFGVKRETIKKRAQRGGWILPSDIEKLALQGKPPLSPKLSPKESKATALALIAESWAEKGEEHRRLTFEKAHHAIRNAKVDAPKNWRDFEIADKVARKAAGLESGDSQVNLAITPMTWVTPGSRLPGTCSVEVATSNLETSAPPLALDEGGDAESD